MDEGYVARVGKDGEDQEGKQGKKVYDDAIPNRFCVKSRGLNMLIPLIKEEEAELCKSCRSISNCQDLAESAPLTQLSLNTRFQHSHSICKLRKLYRP